MPTIKKYSQDRQKCQVTFSLPKTVGATTAAVCGSFNDWDGTSHPMKRAKDGSFKLVVDLAPDQVLVYKYLLDGDRWENDPAADRYEANDHGTENSVVEL